MRLSRIALLAAAVLSAEAASAFDLADVPTSFRGFRIEGNAGGDRWEALGRHRTKFGYGATAGFDGLIYDRVVIGVEGSYWRSNHYTEICAPGLNGGSVCDKSFEEYGAAVRAGYLVTPKLLLFAKGGYANNEQRKSFNPSGSRFYVNGQIVGPEQPYYRHQGYSGYQVGAGAEYSITNLVYANVQYVYSNFETHTLRQRVMGGIGIRFK